MAAPNEITPAQLMRLIGTPDGPAIVDICLDEDFAQAPYLIPGSFRHPHTDIAGLVSRLRGRAAVVVCQKGRKLSQGVAAWLRQDGVHAEYLQGGMLAWLEHPDAPHIAAARHPVMDGSASLWVTRHRPKIDRIACPWLIRRFVDRDARVLFVSPAEVMAVADRFKAIPFDVAGAPYTHQGPQCSFDAMLDDWTLRTPALDRMSRVIRAADTNCHDLSAEAAGLLAFSIGLSRQYRDDTAQLEAALPLYDALYRWARDGQDETHDCPTDQPTGAAA